MSIAPLVVACLALLFTVGSFYWLQARKGSLRVYPVMAFSGSMAADRIILRIPVTLYNTGARPRVVTALRLALADHPDRFLMECHTFRKTIGPEPGDTEDFAHPYVISGRNVVTKFAHFAAEAALPTRGKGPTLFDIEALLDDEVEWKTLGPIEVHTEIMHTAAYITYSNNSGVWGEGLLADAKRYQTNIPPHA